MASRWSDAYESMKMEQYIPKRALSGTLRRLRSTPILKSLKPFLFMLLPTYIQIWVPNSGVTLLKEKKIRKTAFLDGLRGVAALIVVTFHHTSTWNWPRYYQEPFTFGPYPEGKDPMRYTSILQLPIIRLLHSGRAMIGIFFVISGYVLSFRQVELIRSSSYGQLSESLFSSTFRRPVRLFIPSIVGVALWHLTVFLLWYDKNSTKKQRFGVWTGFIDGLGTLFKASWYLDRGPAEIKEGIRQLWTIPVEFAGSIVLFVLISGISRLPTWIRISVILGVMVNTISAGFWGIFLFIAGLLIAEFEAIFQSQEEKTSKLSILRSLAYDLFWMGTLLCGLVVAGYPHFDIGLDPLLSPLLKYTPTWYTKAGGLQVHYFWMSLASVPIVWSLFRFPFLQRIFTTKIALYLGEISYSLYIVHYHLVLPMGLRMHNIANSWFGLERGSHWNQFLAVTFELLPIYFICFWEADLFWRFVDQPCVKFTKWLEETVRKLK